MRLDGTPGVASLLVRKVLDNQRLETSLWRKYYGTSLELDGQNAPTPKLLFINPDKNSKTVKSEMATRKLVQLLAHVQSDKKFYAAKDDHVVSVNFRALARVVARSQFDVQVQWNMDVVRAENIPHANIKSTFESEFAAGAGVNWV